MEQEILVKVKILLGITDDTQDELLMIYIQDLIARVLANIHLATMPEELIPTLPLAVRDYYDSINDEKIKTVSEGDKKVSFGSSNAFLLSKVLSNYDSTLSEFRRITWNI